VETAPKSVRYLRRRRARLLAALLTSALLAATYQLWLPAIGSFLVVADPLRRADAVVPLAGGEQRVAYAAELFRRGYASWFVVTDLAPSRGGRSLSSKENSRAAIERGVGAERIRSTGAVVTSTYAEAQAVRGLAEQQGWRSLIVVTSPEHTRRAQLIFGQVFAGSGIALIVRPAEGSGYTPGIWWQNLDERRLALTEYLKLAAFLIGYP
jgi:uncharacterized SAM-binding protein YcdF (DUF218 family)